MGVIAPFRVVILANAGDDHQARACRGVEGRVGVDRPHYRPIQAMPVRARVRWDRDNGIRSNATGVRGSGDSGSIGGHHDLGNNRTSQAHTRAPFRGMLGLVGEKGQAMSTDQILFGVGLLVVLAVGSQVLASRLRIPALM